MKKYTHLLFDLDHTLWDFNSNCKQTLLQLHNEFKLGLLDISFKDFYTNYIIINNEGWKLYDNNKITKENLRLYRFNHLLNKFGVTDTELAANLEEQYLSRCPKNGLLLPGAAELISSINNNYHLSIITNGFQKTQELKLEFSDLKGYFSTMFTSESVGYKKPDNRYFEHVINHLNTPKENCLVIGDNPNTDIKGARDYGIDTAWINTQNFPKITTCTYYFKELEQFARLITQ